MNSDENPEHPEPHAPSEQADGAATHGGAWWEKERAEREREREGRREMCRHPKKALSDVPPSIHLSASCGRERLLHGLVNPEGRRMLRTEHQKGRVSLR